MGVVLVDEAGQPVDAELRIFPSAMQVAELFAFCRTQWQFNALTGAPVGLLYPGVEAAARMAGILLTPTLFADLRVIEQGALGANPDFPELDGVNIVQLELHDDE